MEIVSGDGAAVGKHQESQGTSLQDERQTLKKAVHDLQILEQKLHCLARKQQIAIDASDLHVDTGSYTQFNLKPTPYQPKRDPDLEYAQSHITKM
ncbi:hypothetical protein BGZ63DRAFT_379738 [Mariannaea sp. PMI_226]|nr:hypothetical protein BGZ63DRAFT_379738 [Mariannaea sp. PMI_226]